jgi:uncharacterized SAM-binding protein YcdF (DUF218 family)
MGNILFIVWAVLAILCFIYGILVYAVGSGTGFFLVWIGLAALFAIFSAAAKRGLWACIPGGLRIAFLVLAGVVLVVFVVIEGCILSGFREEGEEDLDYILVLGAQVYENGPSAALGFRLDKAIEYLEENPETICIVSGGQGYNEPFAEAVGMAAYLEENGISEERIILEAESANTAENIANSMAFLDAGDSVGIVTNNFHMFRALQTARREGLEHVCGITADTTKLYLPNNMLREFFGVVKFYLLSVLA